CWYWRLSSRFDTASSVDQPRACAYRRMRSMAASQNGEMRLSKSNATVRWRAAWAKAGVIAVAASRPMQLRLSIVTCVPLMPDVYDGMPMAPAQSALMNLSQLACVLLHPGTLAYRSGYEEHSVSEPFLQAFSSVP